MSNAERRAAFENMSEWQQREYTRRKAAQDMLEPGYMAATSQRAQKRMARVDSFPPDVRAAIHEYGLEIVQEFWNHGVKKAKSICYLIDVARNLDFDGEEVKPKFRPNKTVSQKTNPLEYASDDDITYSVVRK